MLRRDASLLLARMRTGGCRRVAGHPPRNLRMFTTYSDVVKLKGWGTSTGFRPLLKYNPAHAYGSTEMLRVQIFIFSLPLSQGYCSCKAENLNLAFHCMACAQHNLTHSAILVPVAPSEQTIKSKSNLLQVAVPV